MTKFNESDTNVPLVKSDTPILSVKLNGPRISVDGRPFGIDDYLFEDTPLNSRGTNGGQKPARPQSRWQRLENGKRATFAKQMGYYPIARNGTSINRGP